MSKIIASVSLIWTKIKVIPIKYWFTLFFIIFTLVFGLLEWQQRLRLHPDEISYIEIAQAYKNGNFYEALNAYWNPAFSWLLIPISYITIWPYTGKILNTILISSLFASTFVFSQYIFHNKYKSLLSAILTTLLPGEFIYAWLYVTPDLLLTLFCLWYLFCFFELSKTNSTKNWLFIGILTSIGYLIKNIFLPVVLLFYLLFFLTLQKKVVIKNITSLFIGIVIIASFWSSLLYIKYHKLTLGTSGIVNYYQYVILDKKFDFFNKPSEYHDYGTSYWRDPSSFPKISFNLEKQIEIVYKNTKELLRILIWNINIGWFFILIFIFKSKKTLNQKTIVIFILSWYILYIPILIVPRYIWPTIPLLFILIVGTYNTRLRTFFLIYVLIILLMFTRGYFRYFKQEPIHKISWEVNKKVNPPCVLLSDNWILGMSSAYLSGCKYYGVSESIKKDIVNSEIVSKEIEAGLVTHFLSVNGEKYRNLSFLEPLQTWSVKNQGVILYKYTK